MDVTFDIFYGLGLSIEFVAKDLDQDIEETAVIIEIACFRWIIWTGDNEE